MIDAPGDGAGMITPWCGHVAEYALNVPDRGCTTILESCTSTPPPTGTSLVATSAPPGGPLSDGMPANGSSSVVGSASLGRADGGVAGVAVDDAAVPLPPSLPQAASMGSAASPAAPTPSRRARRAAHTPGASTGGTVDPPHDRASPAATVAGFSGKKLRTQLLLTEVDHGRLSARQPPSWPAPSWSPWWREPCSWSPRSWRPGARRPSRPTP